MTGLKWAGMMVVISALVVLVASACQPAATPPAATPPAILPPAATPPAQESTPNASDIVIGGKIYDKWWQVIPSAAKPTDDHPLWASQTTSTVKGQDTWRCKECHGWDYKGKDGVYGKGSHATGFPGIFNDRSLSRDQLIQIMSGGKNAKHDFRTALGNDNIGKVVDFIRGGLIDESPLIDSATKKPIRANVTHGQELYSKSCQACHGADGKLLNFRTADEPEYIGTLAKDDPWIIVHKIRFGQPGAPVMPAGVAANLSTQDALDILSYTQTLPEK